MNPYPNPTSPKITIKANPNHIDDDEDSLVDQPEYDPYDDSGSIVGHHESIIKC